ncbi:MULTISPECIES: Mrp/NBP35 family ATP-binding protein [Olsenella]|uniref:Mrp/NBP35 family ATP-binding protein n=1 Tax=Olsenella TaxID=133925 RepID=UPI000785B7A8|nr:MULTISPECIES: Mrp/NBP35 family ATP-binding protein [Olsenella]KXB63784.1 nucleotide-binding protein [Olsenella sp. DNF00959]
MADIDEEALRREVDAALGHGGQQQQGPQTFQPEPGSHIKHVIGVISGKGGVGKSLVTGAIATSLRRDGRKVAIMDADITGPSIPKMFGMSGKHALARDEKLVPIESDGGIKVMSTNLVLENETDPVLWRGPMLMGALRQFFEETRWGDIDYLLVDMPPGTGDVALTVFQSLPIEGVVIVSSPQDLVQMVVGKALNMAAMMEVPVIGLVENLSWLPCPNCGERVEPFGPSKLQETAAHFGIAALDQLPIDPRIARSCDEGNFEQVLPESFVAKAVEQIEAHEQVA